MVILKMINQIEKVLIIGIIEKKNEKKEEEKKIPSAKKRLSSAKPSKEITKSKIFRKKWYCQ